MSHPDAERWNARYESEADRWLSRPPRQLLQDYAYLLPRWGIGLDAASGVATNGLFLADRGLDVVALDISETALRLAQKRFAGRGYDLKAAVMDLSRLWLPPTCLDVVLNFHFLERSALPVYRQALKPGGVLIIETFVNREERADHPDYYLQPGELGSYFSELNILHWEEREIPEDEGHACMVTDQFVALKPGVAPG
jgi:SAM-dependent methyltransferase